MPVLKEYADSNKKNGYYIHAPISDRDHPLPLQTPSVTEKIYRELGYKPTEPGPDGGVSVPNDLPEDKSRSIVEDQAEDLGHDVYDTTQPYFSIDPGNGERYDLIYLPLSEGLQAVAVHDEEHGETLDFHKIDELLGGEN